MSPFRKSSPCFPRRDASSSCRWLRREHTSSAADGRRALSLTATETRRLKGRASSFYSAARLTENVSFTPGCSFTHLARVGRPPPVHVLSESLPLQFRRCSCYMLQIASCIDYTGLESERRSDEVGWARKAKRKITLTRNTKEGLLYAAVVIGAGMLESSFGFSRPPRDLPPPSARSWNDSRSTGCEKPCPRAM